LLYKGFRIVVLSELRQRIIHLTAMVKKSSLKNQPILKPAFRQGAIILMVAVALATGAATVYSLSLSPLTKQRSSPTPSASKVTVDAVAALGYLEPQGEVIHLSAPAFMEGARVDRNC